MFYIKNLRKEASDIGVLNITIIGIVAVFVILFILSEVIRLVGLGFKNKKEEPKSQQAGNAFSDLAYFKEREQKDLVIITAIMKNLGHEAPLKIERIN